MFVCNQLSTPLPQDLTWHPVTVPPSPGLGLHHIEQAIPAGMRLEAVFANSIDVKELCKFWPRPLGEGPQLAGHVILTDGKRPTFQLTIVDAPVSKGVIWLGCVPE